MKDASLAEEWWLKAAEQFYAGAQFALGGKYLKDWEERRRDAKDLQAITELGRKGLEMYELAALQGHAAAQGRLAWCFFQGIGTPVLRSLAAQWSERAARQGDSSGLSLLGNMYLNGLGKETDIKKALDLYRKAAAKGNNGALCSLGSLYLAGAGVTRDVTVAIEFLSRAAEAGIGSAAAELGQLYRRGDHGSPNHAKAMHWLLKSRVAQSTAPELPDLKSLALDAMQVRHLPEEIGVEHSWKVLDLVDNAIDDEGANDIARLIRRDTRLRELRLSGNRLGPRGLEEIARAVGANFRLEKVMLDDDADANRSAIARRIEDECGRNLRLQGLLAQWEKAAVEGGVYAIPSELVRLLGEAVIVQDQKFGAAQAGADETRLRLAMLLLSLQELARLQWTMDKR